ncbi:MAG: hypothetical protein OMM_01565 [Candidatus Magnetoglobus multicellularis str. Araruama]|uniref:Bacterial membrane protein YfhO n=1 Tax=Candidatus Magnetoglobus multicellularis str. Araruama TaxID=890399 RepID=A0A1V1PCZ0_9BACT|nr:MAG: hypothetical protein OMM_01565 [Candidatus Magnetoglobus multicellularis str. Araruama]
MLSGMFTYLYLRTINIQLTASVVGAISWMFNGYVMVWLEFENTPMIAFTLPAMLFSIECYLCKKRMYQFSCMILFSALAVSVGYAHLLIYQLIFIGIYILYRFTQTKNNGNPKILFLNVMAPMGAILISFIVCANFFTGHLMMLNEGQRHPYDCQKIFDKTACIPGEYLSTLIFPDIFGSPAKKLSLTPKKHGQIYNNYNEMCIYVGIPTFFLAMISLLIYRQKPFVLFFMLSSFLSLGMAMGSILYYPLIKFVPGLNLSTPTRIVYIFGFAMSILAAFGADSLLDNENKSLKRILPLLWGMIILISLSLALFVQTKTGRQIVVDVSGILANIDTPNQYYILKESIFKYLKQYYAIYSETILTPFVIACSVYILLVCLLRTTKQNVKIYILWLISFILAYDLMSFGLQYNTRSIESLAYPKTPAIEFLQKKQSRYRIMTFGNFYFNGFVPFGIEDIGGYSSFYPGRYGQYIYLSQQGPEASLPERYSRWLTFNTFKSPLIDLLNMKYILISPDTTIQSEQLSLVYDYEIKIYENINAFPRYFMVCGHDIATDKQDALKKVGSYTGEDFKKKVILEKKPGVTYDSNALSINPSYQINEIFCNANKIELSVESTQNGFLVISNNYHPGWEASINGKKTEVFQGNYIMQAVWIPAGKHHLVLEFKPFLMKIGLIVSTAGWLILFGFLIAFCLM